MSQKQPLNHAFIFLTLSLSIYIYISYERTDLTGHKRRKTVHYKIYKLNYL